MNKFINKPFRWAIIYSVILALSAVYVLMDTFVIAKAMESSVAADVEQESSDTQEGSSETDETSDENTISADTQEYTEPVITDTSYTDENISIVIDTIYVNDTTVYVADIQVSDASYIKTAFAEDTYGRNIKETTSEIAEENDAIFAINGDYYGFRDYGFVLRNGVLYRDTASDEEEDEALLIDSEGNFSIINENTADVESIVESGAWQILSFGPALINNGVITVNADSEVSKAKSSNPRTAVGQVDELHYIFIVADGRTDESAGLTLLELAEIFDSYGCTVAYNLDGGGSSTMWFMGEVVNNPVGGKKSDSERSVSDIVYIG